jgi:hypothetical protein
MLEIVVRPELLDYLDTINLGGVILTLALSYRVRTDDWWISFLDEESQPILQGKRIVTGWPLNIGVYDDRLPQGLFVALRLGEGESDARAGELGRTVKLTFFEASDLAALGDEPDLLDPRAIVSIVSGP